MPCHAPGCRCTLVHAAQRRKTLTAEGQRWLATKIAHSCEDAMKAGGRACKTTAGRHSTTMIRLMGQKTNRRTCLQQVPRRGKRKTATDLLPAGAARGRRKAHSARPRVPRWKLRCERAHPAARSVHKRGTGLQAAVQSHTSHTAKAATTKARSQIGYRKTRPFEPADKQEARKSAGCLREARRPSPPQMVTRAGGPSRCQVSACLSESAADFEDHAIDQSQAFRIL